MAITYDITKDYLYQQGQEQGIERGRKQGQQEMPRQMIENLLKLETISPENIAKAASVPLEYVQQIAAELEK
ncbi:MAG: hypothetical protein AVDCRST_MAG56-4184 [uncultured Cytophagales bacterium]|uniref:Uncharacterized protein n=1 Tax=uncultured Cytophagales bacterium TaxID=158755 RepID=A0A6J4JSW3_9SPHI|nr:MAG: hypothetical protein AVDCRST_MAG56-4184 [uncultured Cytophagales bacterium]